MMGNEVDTTKNVDVSVLARFGPADEGNLIEPELVPKPTQRQRIEGYASLVIGIACIGMTLELDAKAILRGVADALERNFAKDGVHVPD